MYPYWELNPQPFGAWDMLQPTEPPSQDSPPNSYVETLMSNVLVLIGGASGRCLSNEDGGLMNGISAFVRGLREIPSPFPHMRTQ